MQYLFTQADFDKPFFTTYFKTSLFIIYLSAFIFWRPWQRLCWCEWRRKRKQQNEETFGSRGTSKSHDQERQCLLGEGGAEEGAVVDEGVGGEGRRVGWMVCAEEGEKEEMGGEGRGTGDEEERLDEERREGGAKEGCMEGREEEGRCRGGNGWSQGREGGGSRGEGSNEGVTVCGDSRRQKGGSCIVTEVDPSTGAMNYDEQSINCQEQDAENGPLRFKPQGMSMDECPLPKPAVCLLVSQWPDTLIEKGVHRV